MSALPATLFAQLTTLGADVPAATDQAKGAFQPFNLFTTLLSHDDEVRLHTRFLHCLLDPNGPHQCGALFLKAFFGVLAKDHPLDHDGKSTGWNVEGTEEWSVQRDVGCGNDGNLDLLAIQPGCVFIIENKTRLVEQPNQLFRYARYLRETHGQVRHTFLLYLTPLGSPSWTAHGSPYARISYEKHVRQWLKECLVLAAGKERLLHAIRQYYDVVDKLVDRTPQSILMDTLAEKILRNSDLLRHRDVIKQALDEAKKRALQELHRELDTNAAPLRFDSPENRAFATSSEGVLDIKPPEHSPLEGAPFRIYVQRWQEKGRLILGLEATETEIVENPGVFAKMDLALRRYRFGKSGGYSTWPVGWVDLVPKFDDEDIANYVGGNAPALVSALVADIKTRVAQIEGAYVAAKSAP